MASIAYAVVNPLNATMNPPSNGPRVKPTFQVTVVSVLAAGSSSGGRMRGKIDARAGLLTAKQPDCAPTMRYSNQTCSSSKNRLREQC